MPCGSKCRESKCPTHENETLSVCTQECTAGCYCDNRKGYKRDLVTNKCVLSADCSRRYKIIQKMLQTQRNCWKCE